MLQLEHFWHLEHGSKAFHLCSAHRQRATQTWRSCSCCELTSWSFVQERLWLQWVIQAEVQPKKHSKRCTKCHQPVLPKGHWPLSPLLLPDVWVFLSILAMPATRTTAECPWAVSQQFAPPGKPWRTAVGWEMELEAPGAWTEPIREIPLGIPMICSQTHSLNPRLRGKNPRFRGFIFNIFTSYQLTCFIYGTHKDGDRNTKEWPFRSTVLALQSPYQEWTLQTKHIQTATTEHNTAQYNQLPHF